MIKVLQITKHMYPYIGGIEQVSRDVEIALGRRDNIKQRIICFNSDSSDGDYVCKKNETVHDNVDGVEVIRCGIVAKMFSQPLSVSFPSELKKVMNSFKPDVVIFHYPNPFAAQFLLSYKKRDFKLIVYWHLDITKQKILGKLFHGQNIALIKRADKIVGATTKHVNESAYTKYFGDKKSVLPYAINEDRLVMSEDEIKASDEIRKKYNDKILCFFIGRHVPYKGLTYLIQASKSLDDRFRFVIAGSGPLTDELKEQAVGDSKIEFLGKISDSEWRSYLKACDIFCFPSITRNEAFGLALAEGMYYEKPVVTFTIKGSGVNYVSINGKTGIECPNGDSKAYAEALKKLADDPKLREEYGKNGRKRVLENFTFDRFVDNISGLISEICEKDVGGNV